MSRGMRYGIRFSGPDGSYATVPRWMAERHTSVMLSAADNVRQPAAFCRSFAVLEFPEEHLGTGRATGREPANFCRFSGLTAPSRAYVPELAVCAGVTAFTFRSPAFASQSRPCYGVFSRRYAEGVFPSSVTSRPICFFRVGQHVRHRCAARSVACLAGGSGKQNEQGETVTPKRSSRPHGCE
jgi:hypothetical protein